MANLRWVGAGGPAYYAQCEDESVAAILYWTDADTAMADSEPVIVAAGWRVVFTDNGDVVAVEDAPALAGLEDPEASEAIDAAVAAATDLLGREL